MHAVYPLVLYIYIKWVTNEAGTGVCAADTLALHVERVTGVSVVLRTGRPAGRSLQPNAGGAHGEEACVCPADPSAGCRSQHSSVERSGSSKSF